MCLPNWQKGFQQARGQVQNGKKTSLPLCEKCQNDRQGVGIHPPLLKDTTRESLPGEPEETSPPVAQGCAPWLVLRAFPEDLLPGFDGSALVLLAAAEQCSADYPGIHLFPGNGACTFDKLKAGIMFMITHY